MAGFSKPTTTQTPDALIDYWLTRLTGSELRVLLYAIRRTYGFKRDEDAISLEQFLHGITTHAGTVLDEGIGISRSALLVAIKSLSERGLLLKIRRVGEDGRDTVSTYRLSIEDERHPRADHSLREVNTTQVPDEIFDYWLSRLSDAELKVLLYIVRRTLGFRKQADAIKPAQFLTGVRKHTGAQLDDGCGVSQKHLYRALGDLQTKGLITVQRRVSARVGNQASVFTLVFEHDLPGLLQATADVDPRARDYRLDDEMPLRMVPRAASVLPSRKDTEGEQKGHRGGPERTQSPTHTLQPGGQKGHIEGSDTIHRGDGHDQEGSVSPATPQQTDLLKEEQQTEKIDIDIESMGSPSFVSQAESDQPTRPDADMRLIGERVTALVTELGDISSPRASVTKATRRWRESGLDAAAFVALMDEAAGVVRTYRPTKPMAYFFTALEDLVRLVAEELQTAPAPTLAPAPPTETDAAWRAVLDDAREALTAENYAVWFAETRVVERDGDLRLVAVPTMLHKHWLEQKLASRIQASLARAGFAGVTPAYQVVASSSDDQG